MVILPLYIISYKYSGRSSSMEVHASTGMEWRSWYCLSYNVMIWLVEPWTKWPPFYRRNFMHFVNFCCVFCWEFTKKCSWWVPLTMRQHWFRVWYGATRRMHCKTNAAKKTWGSVNLKNHILPNIVIFKTCHLYLDTSIIICLGELSVGQRTSIPSLSFSIICAVVTFQHVEKVFPDRCF